MNLRVRETGFEVGHPSGFLGILAYKKMEWASSRPGASHVDFQGIKTCGIDSWHNFTSDIVVRIFFWKLFVAKLGQIGAGFLNLSSLSMHAYISMKCNCITVQFPLRILWYSLSGEGQLQSDLTLQWKTFRTNVTHAILMQNHHTNRLRGSRASENQKPRRYFKKCMY